MHELAITRSIVAIVAEQAAGRRVLRVTLEIGELSAVMPEAIRFCFDVVAADSALAGAALDIVAVPGRARCEECGAEIAIAGPVARCPCGSRRLERLAGEELNIKSMELEAA
ncbi:hydrogenase maturation nickel metallochaperone HypA [Pseudoxanthobacter sp. M-2]|uniref:hydrogenase maturation nickel metallochaperone HypA n=1 Tax=Pseudoxanthobacter sp. M-2 TaxID=3078754 RepID=UPI0038FC0274